MPAEDEKEKICQNYEQKNSDKEEKQEKELHD